MLDIHHTYSLRKHNTSVRRILDHTDPNPSGVNLKPLQYNVRMGVWRCEFERLNTRAALQQAEFIIVEV